MLQEYVNFIWVFYRKFLYISNFTPFQGVFTPLINTFFSQISFCTPSDHNLSTHRVSSRQLQNSGFLLRDGQTDLPTDRPTDGHPGMQRILPILKSSPLYKILATHELEPPKYHDLSMKFVLRYHPGFQDAQMPPSKQITKTMQ